MWKAVLREVRAHKARLAMTMLAVLLGTAFVSGTLVFTDTVSAAYRGSAERSFTGIDVQLRARSQAGHDTARLIDERLLTQARALPGAASASGLVAGFAALAGKDGEMVGDGWATRGTNSDGRHPFAEGRAPQAAGEVAIDARTAERTGYAVGDSVRLSVSGPVLDQRVTGIFRTDDGNVAAGGTLTLFDTATAQALFAEPARYNQIELAARPGVSAEELRRQAQTIAPHGIEAVTAAQLATEQADRNAQSVKTLAPALLACAGIALFVGGFLIVNTFTMLVASRTRQLALLRAVGASRGQVTRSVLAEAAVVGFVATAAGLATGVLVGAGVPALLAATGDTVPEGAIVVSPATVLIVMALGVGVTLCAAWLPAHRAATVPPVAAMSAVHAPATARSLVVRNTAGAFLTAAGAALVVAATAVDSEGLLALGGFLLAIGVIVLTPLLSRVLIAAARPVLRRFGVVGLLAGQNAVRNPRRTAATASALTIGLTLITALTVTAASADKAIDKLAGEGFVRADYYVSMANAGPLAAQTEKTLSDLDGVVAVSPRREIPARVAGGEQIVVGFRTAQLDKLLDIDFTQGGFAPGQTVIVDQETADARGWRLGDTVDVTWPDGAGGELTLSGFYTSAFDDGFKTDLSVMDPHLDRPTAQEILVATRGGASEATEVALRAALGHSPAIRVQDRQEVADGITGSVGLVLNLLYGMLALAVVVAVLGVVNTLAMSVHERAKEIALLRAVGLDRRRVKRMVRLESLVIALFGGVLGVGLGAFLGWGIGELVASIGIDTWTLVLPWGRMALFLATAGLVGVLAALWPARRAARTDMLAAINAE